MVQTNKTKKLKKLFNVWFKALGIAVKHTILGMFIIAGWYGFIYLYSASLNAFEGNGITAVTLQVVSIATGLTGVAFVVWMYKVLDYVEIMFKEPLEDQQQEKNMAAVKE